MSDTPPIPKQVVGIQPWLPWPLSAWSWWTEPVRAERLAALRIGVGLCILWDVGYNYAPEIALYYGKDGLGDASAFNWRFQAPRTTWSLLRGFGDSPTMYLALAILVATTLWIIGNLLARILVDPERLPRRDRTGFALALWSVSFFWYVGGIWSLMIRDQAANYMAWLIPILGVSMASLFFALEQTLRLREPDHRFGPLSTRLSFYTVILTLILGVALFAVADALKHIDPRDDLLWWVRYFGRWQDDHTLLTVALIIWLASAFFLFAGCFTRIAAIVAWVTSMSFANSNPYLDNAGDTIRLMLLFYLMLCPSGAALSVDALFAKRQGPVHVHPWPIRLIFVQMIFIYFMNGLYKLFGASWLSGNSLYFVLGDAALSRFSQEQLAIPFEITRMMTWSVLAWEASFPLLVLFKWPRRFALIMGVMFHLGIFATMELGGFVPYALCMYLPLAPWEKLRREPDLPPPEPG